MEGGRIVFEMVLFFLQLLFQVADVLVRPLSRLCL